jgi:CDP-4-dehydro-6-deoxyglucose reductase
MKARLRIEPYGRTVEVRQDQTLLDAALSSGLNLPHSCKSGHCASCRARLRSGDIQYPHGRPLGLTGSEAASGQILLCQARAASPQLVIEARSIARAGEAEIRNLPCRIERRVLLAPDVMQGFLRLPATEQVGFQPGQYLDVLLDGGQRRSFSLACPPHDARLLEIHARRVAHGRFTEQLFGQMRDGALLRIELPIGQFAYRHDDAPLILVAGGTGFAPIKSIMRHVFEKGPARGAHFFWGARTRADLYQDSWLREFQRTYPQLRYTPVLSDEAAVEGYEQGWVHAAVLRHYPHLSKHVIYAAGPPQMIEAMRVAFPAAGLAADQLRFDSFDYAPAASSVE